MSKAYYAQVRTDGTLDPRIARHPLCNKTFYDDSGNVVAKIFPRGYEGTFILPISSTPNNAIFTVATPVDSATFIKTTSKSYSRNEYYDIVDVIVNTDSTEEDKQAAWDKLPFLADTVNDKGTPKKQLFDIDKSLRNRYTDFDEFFLDTDGQLYKRIAVYNAILRVEEETEEEATLWADSQPLRAVLPRHYSTIPADNRAYIAYTPDKCAEVEENAAREIILSAVHYAERENTKNLVGSNVTTGIRTDAYHKDLPAFFDYLDTIAREVNTQYKNLSSAFVNGSTDNAADIADFDYNGEFAIDPALWAQGAHTEEEIDSIKTKIFDTIGKMGNIVNTGAVDIDELVSQSHKQDTVDLPGVTSNPCTVKHTFSISALPEPLHDVAYCLARTAIFTTPSPRGGGVVELHEEDNKDIRGRNRIVPVKDVIRAALGMMDAALTNNYANRTTEALTDTCHTMRTHEYSVDSTVNTPFKRLQQAFVYHALSTVKKRDKKNKNLPDYVETSPSVKTYMEACANSMSMPVESFKSLRTRIDSIVLMDTVRTWCDTHIGDLPYDFAEVIDPIVIDFLTAPVERALNSPRGAFSTEVDFSDPTGNDNEQDSSNTFTLPVGEPDFQSVEEMAGLLHTYMNLWKDKEIFITTYGYDKVRGEKKKKPRFDEHVQALFNTVNTPQKRVELLYKAVLCAYIVNFMVKHKELGGAFAGVFNHITENVEQFLAPEHLPYTYATIYDIDLDFLLSFIGTVGLDNTSAWKKHSYPTPSFTYGLEGHKDIAHLYSIAPTSSARKEAVIATNDDTEKTHLFSGCANLPFDKVGYARTGKNDNSVNDNNDTLYRFINRSVTSGAFSIGNPVHYTEIGSYTAERLEDAFKRHPYTARTRARIDSTVRNGHTFVFSGKAAQSLNQAVHNDANVYLSDFNFYTLVQPHNVINARNADEDSNYNARAFYALPVAFHILAQACEHNADIDLALWKEVINNAVHTPGYENAPQHTRWKIKGQGIFSSLAFSTATETEEMLKAAQHIVLRMLHATAHNDYTALCAYATIPANNLLDIDARDCGESFFDLVSTYDTSTIPIDFVLKLAHNGDSTEEEKK